MKKLILITPALFLFFAACTKNAEPIKVSEIKEGEYEPKE